MKPKLAFTIPASFLSLLAVATPALQGGGQEAPAKIVTTTGGQGAATTGVAVPGATTGQGPATTAGAPGAVKAASDAKALQAAKGAPSMKAGAPPTPPKPPKPAWKEFKLNPKTTIFLDFTESSPDMIISILSRTAGITILKDPSFKSPMTLTSAKAVGLDEAFEIFNTMLEMNGYELRKQGNLMIVGKKQPPQPVMQPQAPPPQPPPQENPVIKVYKLQFASAQQVSRVVNEVFSQQQLEQIIQGLQNGGGFNGGGPQFGGRPGGPQQPKAVRASSEDYSNSVVVTALPKFQTDVEALIKELDKPSDTPLDSQIFKLKYVDVDEAVDAVNSVLSANKPTGRGAGKSNSGDQGSYYGFYGYNPFGSSRSQGGETAIAVKQTNSIIVSATKANMDLIRKLITDMDKESAFIGTTFVVHLENAKAADVATLLNQAFTKRRDQGQDDNPFFFFYSDSFGGNNKKKDIAKDVDDAGEVVNVRDLTGKVNVIADPNTNSVIVVTMPSNMKIIRRVVDQLDHIAEQVMIETVIVEANLDKTTKLGVEYKFLQNKVLNWNATSTGSQNFGGVQGTATNPAQGFSYTLNGSDYNVFINALQTDSRFKVLSTPRIFTSNNVKASIDVSQQVPYITSQQAANAGGLITQYDFKPVGVILTVTPRITAAGEVSMEVTQSADDLQGFTSFNAPIINHRQASTTASVKDGETIVLGGIIRSTTNLTENKVPILGDIPLIGNLFKSTNRSRGQTELLVLLTPRIVRNPEEAKRLREEETKRLSKGSQDAIQKQLNPPPPNK